jgi:hypothetical protein
VAVAVKGAEAEDDLEVVVVKTAEQGLVLVFLASLPASLPPCLPACAAEQAGRQGGRHINHITHAARAVSVSQSVSHQYKSSEHDEIQWSGDGE